MGILRNLLFVSISCTEEPLFLSFFVVHFVRVLRWLKWFTWRAKMNGSSAAADMSGYGSNCIFTSPKQRSNELFCELHTIELGWAERSTTLLVEKKHFRKHFFLLFFFDNRSYFPILIQMTQNQCNQTSFVVINVEPNYTQVWLVLSPRLLLLFPNFKQMFSLTSRALLLLFSFSFRWSVPSNQWDGLLWFHALNITFFSYFLW